MLELRHISKDYHAKSFDVHALQDVSLTFRKSELAAILGPSGCGKTTLLNVVGGLDQYDAGELIIEGVSTKKYRDTDWDTYRNQRVGFVFQNYNLIRHMSVLDNVALSLSLAGVKRSERIRKAKIALEKVGLGEQIKKRPNQLSGGQMQRVAIARAIANDPEIVLADEPTGALDSETSVQVAELLKEIAKERLVIMVTHNQSLAEQYATRTISLLDGRIVSDTDPYEAPASEEVAVAEAAAEPEVFVEPEASDDTTASEPVIQEPVTKREKKVRMSLLTAFGISFKRIFTKKWRTFFLCLAGSIGIFGIAIVLAISAGMNSYVAYLQTEAVGDSAITIAETAYNLDDVGKILEQTAGGTPYPKDTEGIYPYVGKNDLLSSIRVSNNITDDYVAYLKSMDPSWRNAITLSYSAAINVLHKNEKDAYVKLASWASYSKQIIDNHELVEDNYDVLFKLGDGETEAGDYTGNGYPSDYREVAIVVDRYNRLNANALVGLGLMEKQSDDLPELIPYEDIVGYEYSLILNDGWYQKTQKGTFSAISSAKYKEAAEGEHCIKVKIVSVLRPKNDKANQWLTAGLAYLPSLSEALLEDSSASEVVTAQVADPDTNVLTGLAFTNSEYGTVTKEQAYQKALKSLGGIATPTGISIYPKNSVAKMQILDYLDAWNTEHPECPVVYTDYTTVALSALNALVNVVTYILVAFSAISLVVSTVMIAVVMNMSVLERTREIGVLRSLGARKLDIANLFNCETFVIGLTAGILGIAFGLLGGLIANSVLGAAFGVSNIVRFSWPIVGEMLALSLGLTLLAGLIPAVLAARRDPVKCLRTD